MEQYNFGPAGAQIPDATGATAQSGGARGLVPAPSSGDQDKFLKGDGTWGSVPSPAGKVDISQGSANAGKILRVGNDGDLALDGAMIILSYGSSTWSDFITAYNSNSVVYCRASSNSDPSSGSQTRLAFMAYVNNAASPTEVEFQYYRSVSSHTAAQQGDQVFVYKLTSSGSWTVTTREATSKIVAGTNMDSSYSNGTLTLSATDTTYSDFSGSTHGLVPAASSVDSGKFLKGNGIWSDVPAPSVMTGATSSSAGTSGLVPAPSAGDQDKVLKGNGTWGTVDALPAVTSSDNGKSLDVVNGIWTKGEKKINEQYEFSDGFVENTEMMFPATFSGNYIWTDGENIYYSYSTKNYILDKSTSTWSTKVWTGLTNFGGNNIWSDGDSIYYSNGYAQYILDKSTSNWSLKTWIGLTNFDGFKIWTDGNNIYYSSDTDQYILDKSTSTWSTKVWTGLTDFRGDNIWSDGDSIYYSGFKSGVKQQYVLNGSTWSTKTWTGLTIFYGSDVWSDGDSIYYSSSTTQYVLNKSTSTWSAKTWIGLTDFYGRYLWLEGNNVYYSVGSSQYILDKTISTWSIKTWIGLISFYGVNIWTDEDNIYYSSSPNHYILDKSTLIWSAKTWTGLTNFDGPNIWTDGTDIYYSSNTTQYVLNKSTSTWSAKTWSGLNNFIGQHIWSDGDNIYYSNGSTQYVLNKSTSTWSEKTWSGLNNFIGQHIWSDGDNIYYSNGSTQYVLNKSTSTWSAKTWTGLTNFYGIYIWSDGDSIYYSNGYILDKSTSTWLYKSWTGFNNFSGDGIWTDGNDIYYSNGAEQYKKTTDESIILGKNGTYSKSSLSDFKEKIGVTDLEDDVSSINAQIANLITWTYIDGTTTASGNIKTDLVFDNGNYYYVVACVAYNSGGWSIKGDIMTTPIVYKDNNNNCYVGFNLRSIVSPYNAVSETSVRISFGYILRR